MAFLQSEAKCDGNEACDPYGHDVNAEAIVSVHVAAWREAELRKPGAYCKPHHPQKSIGVRVKAYRTPARATDDAAVPESSSLDRDPEPR
jgi:hypothetical protein